MQAPANSKTKPRRKTKKRVLKAILLFLVVIAVLVFFVVPLFVSSESGREIILGRIRNSVDGEIDFSDLSMGWRKGVEIDDFKFRDRTGSTFVQVKRITTKPYYVSILMGNLSFGETEILEPRVEVNLIQPEPQVPQSVQGEKAAVDESQPFILPIKRIDVIIKDGSLKVTDAKAGTVELSQINSKVNLRRAGEQADFDVNMVVAGTGSQSKVHTAGQFNLRRASGDVTVKVDDLWVGALEPIFALAGVDIQAEGDITADVNGEIKRGQIEKLSGEVKGRDLDINTVELTGGRFKTSRLDVNVNLARAGQMINIESFNIGADWLTAEGQGTIPTTSGSLGEFLKSDASLSGHFELDAAQLFSQMPGLLKLRKGTKLTSGVLRGDVETLTEGGKRKIRGQATLGGLEGVVADRVIALSEPVEAEVEVTSDKEGVKFDRLGLSSAFAKVDCSGTSKSFKYEGDFDLAKLQAELGQFVDTRGYGIGGEVSSEGTVDIEESEVTVASSSAIKNLRVGYPGKRAFEQKEVSLGFDAVYGSAEKSIVVKKFNLQSDQIKIQDGEFSQTYKGDKAKLQGRAELEYDWAAVSSILGMFLPEGLVLEGQRKDTVSFISEYPKGRTDEMLANLSSRGKLGFTKASYFGLNFGQTEVDVQVQNGLLNIAPFSTTVNNGKLNFAAKIDLKQKPMVLQTSGPMQIIDKVEINEQVSRSLLVYLNPIFKDQAGITGIANFHSERLSIPLGGNTNMRPEIVGTVSIEKMKLETKGLLGNILSRAGTGRYITAALLPTKFVLREGKLSYDNMQINLDRYPTNFVGSIGPNRILDMKVITPYVLTKDFKLETAKIDEERTAERIPLPLTGTIDSPQLDWSKLAGELLQQQLKSGRLGEELEGLFEKLNKGSSSAGSD